MFVSLLSLDLCLFASFTPPGSLLDCYLTGCSFHPSVVRLCPSILHLGPCGFVIEPSVGFVIYWSGPFIDWFPHSSGSCTSFASYAANTSLLACLFLTWLHWDLDYIVLWRSWCFLCFGRSFLTFQNWFWIPLSELSVQCISLEICSVHHTILKEKKNKRFFSFC